MTIRGIPPQVGPVATPVGQAAAVQRSGSQPKEPGLWAMLSPAERAFFLPPDGDAAVGYGRSGRAERPAPLLGQHLDVVG